MGMKGSESHRQLLHGGNGTTECILDFNCCTMYAGFAALGVARLALLRPYRPLKGCTRARCTTLEGTRGEKAITLDIPGCTTPALCYVPA